MEHESDTRFLYDSMQTMVEIDKQKTEVMAMVLDKLTQLEARVKKLEVEE